MNKLALATLAAINIASAVKIEQSSKSTNEELADNMETLAGGVSTIDDEILEANGNIDDLEMNMDDEISEFEEDIDNMMDDNESIEDSPAAVLDEDDKDDICDGTYFTISGEYCGEWANATIKRLPSLGRRIWEHETVEQWPSQ